MMHVCETNKPHTLGAFKPAYVVSIHGNAYAVQNDSMVDIFCDSTEDNALGSGRVCAPFIYIKYCPK
jgi:hypothetical protein